MDAVNCVRMVNSVDVVVAAGHASGLVSVFQLPSAIPRANNTVMNIIRSLTVVGYCFCSGFLV